MQVIRLILDCTSDSIVSALDGLVHLSVLVANLIELSPRLDLEQLLSCYYENYEDDAAKDGHDYADDSQLLNFVYILSER